MELLMIYLAGAITGAVLVWCTKKEKSNWIPVDKRLPESPCDVEVTLQDGTVTIGYYVLWNWRRSADGQQISVKAWKETPEPYKESED